jgi:hypothetical protein
MKTYITSSIAMGGQFWKILSEPLAGCHHMQVNSYLGASVSSASVHFITAKFVKYTPTCTCTCTQTHAHAHIHTHTHTRTNTRTHTCAHTRTHAPQAELPSDSIETTPSMEESLRAYGLGKDGNGDRDGNVETKEEVYFGKLLYHRVAPLQLFEEVSSRWQLLACSAVVLLDDLLMPTHTHVHMQQMHPHTLDVSSQQCALCAGER